MTTSKDKTDNKQYDSVRERAKILSLSKQYEHILRNLHDILNTDGVNAFLESAKELDIDTLAKLTLVNQYAYIQTLEVKDSVNRQLHSFMSALSRAERDVEFQTLKKGAEIFMLSHALVRQGMPPEEIDKRLEEEKRKVQEQAQRAIVTPKIITGV